MAYHFGNLVNVIDNVVKGSPTPSEKIANFFICYVNGNGIREAARQCDLNENTARSWRSRDWWAEVESAARKVTSQKSDRHMTKLLDRALESVSERLEKGDPYTHQGTVGYKPVTARDSALIAAILYDKRALIRGEPTNIGAEVSEKERLESLSERFESIAQGKFRVVAGGKE